jgi:hypothetical protein
MEIIATTEGTTTHIAGIRITKHSLQLRPHEMALVELVIALLDEYSYREIP